MICPVLGLSMCIALSKLRFLSSEPFLNGSCLGDLLKAALTFLLNAFGDRASIYSPEILWILSFWTLFTLSLFSCYFNDLLLAFTADYAFLSPTLYKNPLLHGHPTNIYYSKMNPRDFTIIQYFTIIRYFTSTQRIYY